MQLRDHHGPGGDGVRTIYAIPAPDSMRATIEVYGDQDMGWYEWRILDAGRVVYDTGTEGNSHCWGRQYGQAEIALRDALIYASGGPCTDGLSREGQRVLGPVLDDFFRLPQMRTLKGVG
jgi:hypothetical protein